VRGHDAARTLLDWRSVILEVTPPVPFAIGARVDWTVPVSGVVLHRRDRPSRGEHENPVVGTVDECVTLGDDTAIGLRIPAAGDALLTLRVPTHVARRNGIVLGVSAGASLLADAIHVMPAEASAVT
jgi:molybdate transport system ATP-binding protein